MEFCHNNHLVHGFINDDGKITSEFIANGIFYVKVGTPDRAIGTPLEEAIRAARLIRASTTEDLWLCLSGGVDSEAMARSFLEANIDFSVAIMRFNDDLNWFDIKHAVSFCRDKNLPFRFFDLDVGEFYLSGRHFEYAREFRCTSPQLTSHLYLMEQIPGFPVLSWNLTTPYLTSDGRVTYAMPSDLYFCYERFLRARSRPGAPLFFLYTPELFYSLLRQPLVQDFVHNRGDSRKNNGINYATKCEIYRQGGFAVSDRDDKFTGFEEVKKFFQNHFTSSLTAFDDHFRVPMKNQFPEPARIVFELSQDHLIVR